MTEYRLMPWAEAYATHSAEWLAIGQNKGLNISLLPDWTRIVVECLTEPLDVHVLVGTEGSRLVDLLPFHLRNDRISRIPVRLLEPISAVVAYHAEFVSRDNPARLLRALVKTRDNLSWDLIRLAGTLSGSASEQAVRDVTRQDSLTMVRWPGRRSPYFHLGTTSEKLVASRDKRDRYLIRKHAKDFAAAPGAAMRWYGKDADSGQLLDAILHVEAGSWKERAGVSISGNPRETAFYRSLLPWLSANGHLLANVVSIDGSPVAYCLCYVWNGSYGCIKGSYREEFAKLAVGHHASDQLVIRAADDGGTEFDFLGDADPYKLAWSPATRDHSDYFIYSPRGLGRWLGLAQRARNHLRPPKPDAH